MSIIAIVYFSQSGATTPSITVATRHECGHREMLEEFVIIRAVQE